MFEYPSENGQHLRIRTTFAMRLLSIQTRKVNVRCTAIDITENINIKYAVTL